MTKDEALAQLVDAARHLVRLTSQDPILRAATPVLEMRAMEKLTQAVAVYDAAEAQNTKAPRKKKGTPA